MADVVTLSSASSLVGTWVSSDEHGSTVQYTVSPVPAGFAVSVGDTYDGELGVVSDIVLRDGVLSFQVLWPSTGRTCQCEMRPVTRDKVDFTFSYTEREYLRRRAT